MRRGLSILFIAAAVMILSPHPARSESWGFIYDATLKSPKVKIKATMCYMDPVTGKLVKKKYKPTDVEFSLTKDVDGTADTTIIVYGGGIDDLTASMHGSVTRVGDTYNLSGSYYSDNELTDPFNFLDEEEGIDSDGVMATTVEGTYTEVVSNNVPTGDIKLKFTYTMFGMTDTGYMAKIYMTLYATASSEE